MRIGGSHPGMLQRQPSDSTGLGGTPRSRQFHASKPLGLPWGTYMEWPPEGFERDQIVRALRTNEECVIEGFFSTSGENVMRCRSERDKRVIFLQPKDVSHELDKKRYPYIESDEMRWYPYYVAPHNGGGTNFELGNDVIVKETGKKGRVRMLNGMSTSSGLMGIDFGEGVDAAGVRILSWYDAAKLTHV